MQFAGEEIFKLLTSEAFKNKEITDDFRRATESIESDPPDSITASCSMVEGVCKYILQELGATLPPEQTIRPLVHKVLEVLDLTPETQEDEDLRRVCGGLLNIAQRIGSLRTKYGDAHNSGPNGSIVIATYARLALGSALVLASFLIEVLDKQEEFNLTAQETMQKRISYLLKKYNRTVLDLDSDDPLPFRCCPKCGSGKENLIRSGSEPNLAIRCNGRCKNWSLEITGDKIHETYPADLLKGRE